MNSICVIINVEGFHVNGNFYCKELGFISCTARHPPGVEKFNLLPFDLPDSAWDATEYGHGLAFEIEDEERDHIRDLDTLPLILLDLWTKNKIPGRDLVAFYDDSFLEDYLHNLGIPAMNLRNNLVPHYKVIMACNDLGYEHTCGMHINHRFEVPDCSMVQVQAYRFWVRRNIPFYRI